MLPALIASFLLLFAAPVLADDQADLDALINSHAGQTGTLVLDRGEHSLLVRAWLADHAKHSIDVQYFIWSTDNIGILASESLLRAAARGVKVRVIVDDLLVDAPDDSLLALAAHPNIDIRFYNPMHSVGVSWYRRLWNLLTNFRGANQRMHDKTLIVDGRYAITGGRNMADEYFDFDHKYNFRDRDALVLGAVVSAMRSSFESFWASPQVVPLEKQLRDAVTPATIRETYARLQRHAADPKNFAPEVHAALANIPDGFRSLAPDLSWGRVDFINDRPGKNDGRQGLGGAGLSTAALAQLVEQADDEVLIQSPYLVLSDEALGLFRRTIKRGVRIRISTNSLASTDNLQAFSGYRNQRAMLLDLGVELREYRPDPAVAQQVMQRYAELRALSPIFALHAKTMVIDRDIVYIGTYNLDPRSENLNTEVGVVIHDATQAGRVAASIETDMQPANSWNPMVDYSDAAASFGKRLKVSFWQLLPIRALL